MRFIPYCLFALLAAAPSLGKAQTALKTTPLKDSHPEAGEPPLPPEATGCGSQAYTGFVKSAEKSLAGVSVFVKGTSIVLVTNELGYFVLPPSVQTWPTLSVSAMGYEPVAVTYRTCEPVMVEMTVLPGTKFKKHGRKKGWIVPPKRKK